MSNYPYWKNGLETKRVSMDLEILENSSLEDGLFYGETLSIVDASGKPIPYKLGAQDIKETTKAGRGIYGIFEINKKPLNPCTVTYIPRYMEETEDHRYVKDTFDLISEVDISKHSNNIDDMLVAKVRPKVDATLAFGNFANTTQMVEALNRLRITLASYYFDETQLPAAIEDVYLHTKDSYYDDLEVMRNLTVKEINPNQVMSESLRILSRPPAGTMFGNYIFIAYRDEVGTYRETTYTLKRGDICVIEQGELTILPFGTDYSYKQRVVDNLLSELDNFASNGQVGLETYSKELSEAIDEVRTAANGFYADSLYVEKDISDSSLFTATNGIVLGNVSETFEYEDIIYEKGDIVLIVDGKVRLIGITEERYTQLEIVSSDLDTKLTDLKKVYDPIVSMSDLVSSQAGLSSSVIIPSRTGGEIDVSDGDLVIAGKNISNSEFGEYLSDMLSTIATDTHIDNPTALKLISGMPVDTTSIETMNRRVDRLNTILDNRDKGGFVLQPLNLLSMSGYYYNDQPITITDKTLEIRGMSEMNLPEGDFVKLTFIGDRLFVIMSSGVFEVNFSIDKIIRPSGYKSVSTATEVISIGNDIALVTPVSDNSMLETISATHVVPGEVVTSIPGSDVVVSVNDSGLMIKNVETNKVKTSTLICDNGFTSNDDVVLTKDGIIVGTIKNGVLREISYAEDLNEPGLTIRDGYPYPIVTLDKYPVGLKVVLL